MDGWIDEWIDSIHAYIICMLVEIFYQNCSNIGIVTTMFNKASSGPVQFQFWMEKCVFGFN